MIPEQVNSLIVTPISINHANAVKLARRDCQLSQRLVSPQSIKNISERREDILWPLAVIPFQGKLGNIIYS